MSRLEKLEKLGFEKFIGGSGGKEVKPGICSKCKNIFVLNLHRVIPEFVIKNIHKKIKNPLILTSEVLNFNKLKYFDKLLK